MTDPIAEAAAAQQAQTEQTGVIDKVEERLNQFAGEMMEKMEHMIHPVDDAAPSSTEPQAVSVGIENKPSLAQAPIATAEVVQEVAASTTGEASTEVVPEAVSAEQSAPVDAPAVGTSQSESPAEAVAVAQSEQAPNAAPTPPAGNATPVGGDAPNAAASPVVAASESATASSASPASPASVIEAQAGASVSPSEVARARVAIDHLRAHLWTFETSAVQHLHNELNYIEGLFK